MLPSGDFMVESKNETHPPVSQVDLVSPFPPDLFEDGPATQEESRIILRGEFVKAHRYYIYRQEYAARRIATETESQGIIGGKMSMVGNAIFGEDDHNLQFYTKKVGEYETLIKATEIDNDMTANLVTHLQREIVDSIEEARKGSVPTSLQGGERKHVERALQLISHLQLYERDSAVELKKTLEDTFFKK